jgi:hypothetical protein
MKQNQYICFFWGQANGAYGKYVLDEMIFLQLVMLW